MTPNCTTVPDRTMTNGRISNFLRRLLAPAALLALLVLAACTGRKTEKGVLPAERPQGEAVALAYDASGGRLVEAYRNALYWSADGGASRQPVPVPPSVQRGRIAAVAAVPGADSGTTLYLAGPGIGVLRSDDAGRSWVALDKALPSTDITAFATHATDPRTLYVVVPERGIFRSEDAGETWKRLDAGPGAPVRQIVHSNMPGSMQSGWLFAATTGGVRRSMDCFCGWRPTGALPGGAISAVAYDPRQPERVYAATTNEVFRSENGGESWERVSGGGPVRTALAVDQTGVLYAATPGGTLLRSTDQGRTWEPPGA